MNEYELEILPAQTATDVRRGLDSLGNNKLANVLCSLELDLSVPRLVFLQGLFKALCEAFRLPGCHPVSKCMRRVGSRKRLLTLQWRGGFAVIHASWAMIAMDQTEFMVV
jgi:hypothetical protein